MESLEASIKACVASNNVGFGNGYGISSVVQVVTHSPSHPLGSAPARLLRLLRARRVAPCSSALPGRAPATGTPATASGALTGARASRTALHRPFAHFTRHCACPLKCATVIRSVLMWPLRKIYEASEPTAQW